MSLELIFEIDVRSDYHVGAGYGNGSEIDSALLRDVDGIPVFRGTMISGLLRDGVWRLLQLAPFQDFRLCRGSGNDEKEAAYCGQDEMEHNHVLCPICRLFGTPRHMKHWRFGSARPKSHNRLTGAYYTAEETGSQRVTRVRVNPRTRRAAPRKLFSEEHGAQDVYTFSVECNTVDAARLDEAAFLVAAARFVRQLGRSRRRGEGECLFSMVDVRGADLGPDPQAALLQRFEERWLKGRVALDETSASRTLAEDSLLTTSTEHSRRFEILVRLDEPLIVAERASAGNRFESKEIISGKTLRGALAHQTAQVYDLTHHKTYDAFVKLFLHGAVRFPTLHPLFESYPSVPIPSDGVTCKVYEDHPVQWGTQHDVETCAASECDKAVRRVRDGFVALRQDMPEHFSPKKRTEMHIRIDPKTGRVVEGDLYDFVPLEAGQYFVGELTCADDNAWLMLKAMTGLEEKVPFNLRIGKATQRGYGGVTVWVQSRQKNAVPLWIQQPIADRLKVGDREVVLTLLTDTIIVDAWGGFVTDFSSDWLSQVLELPVSIVDGRAFADSHTVDGFNSQWRLPTWRAEALEGGSTVRLKLPEPLTSEMISHLGDLEREGVGERRVEGYGAIAFNHPVYSACAGLTMSRIRIPEALELATKSGEETPLDCREMWALQLELVFEQHSTAWRGQPFTALARWLYINRFRMIDALLDEIEVLGRVEDALRDQIRSQAYQRDVDEYGAREMVNHLKTKKALTDVPKLLRYLRDDLPVDFWPSGIAMLADRLAEVAEMQKEDAR